MRISVSGPPGSGKTTVCQLVAKALGLRLLLVGQVFRQMALERKVDLETFGGLAEEDETIDKELDERMVRAATKEEDIVLEGRLSGAMLKARNVPVLAVYIDASPQVRARRIAGREGKPVDAVLGEIQTRERSERKRYLAYYGIDPSDRSCYDLWIDSTDLSADKVAEIIIQEARRTHGEDAHKGKGCL